MAVKQSRYHAFPPALLSLVLSCPAYSSGLRRELVDGGYEAWVRAVMAAVEAAGATDAKHGTRLRLENYAFLQLGLQVRLHSVCSCSSPLLAVVQLGRRYELTACELGAALWRALLPS